MKPITSDEQMALIKLGRRIQQNRIALNITQKQLADRCGISVSTEIRMENGADTKMSNYIKVLSAMNMQDNLEFFIPEVAPKFRIIYERSPQSRRVAAHRRVKKTNTPHKVTWVWGEDR